MHRRPTILTAAAAVAAAATLLLSGCVAGEGAASGSTSTAGVTKGGTLNIDFATYNPLSLVIKKEGWLEKALKKQDITVNWVQSAGSNKANEALRSGAIDVGSTAGSAALLARANGSDIKTIDIFSQPEWSAATPPHRRLGRRLRSASLRRSNTTRTPNSAMTSRSASVSACSSSERNRHPVRTDPPSALA